MESSNYSLQIEAHSCELEAVMNECKDAYIDYYPGGDVTPAMLYESVRTPFLWKHDI